MSNQLMNPDFANHFVALLPCILTNRTKFTCINQTMYQLVCKLFILSFSCLQTINIYLGFFDFANSFFSGFFIPPPFQKNNGPSLSIPQLHLFMVSQK